MPRFILSIFWRKGTTIFVFIICCFKWQPCDILYLLFNLICIEICLVISFVTNVLEVENQNDVVIYKKALIRKSVWLKSYIIWLVVHYWLIGAALMATINVIYIGIDSMEQKHIIMYSILSLFLTCVGYAVSPLVMATGYRKAYCCLDKAIVVYEQNKIKEERAFADYM